MLRLTSPVDEATKAVAVRRVTRPPSLFWRIFLIDAAVLAVAVGALAFGPFTVSAPILLGELSVLVAGLAIMLLVSHALLGARCGRSRR